MGYFSNGTEGDIYEATYCTMCVHQDPEGEGCAVWLAHCLHNYKECNNKDSILHLLIPKGDGKSTPWNGQCRMFHRKP